MCGLHQLIINSRRSSQNHCDGFTAHSKLFMYRQLTYVNNTAKQLCEKLEIKIPIINRTVAKYEVHPKSNWKMWIKREWLQLGGWFFLEFLKASIADLITLFFHRYKTLKAVATATAAIVFLTTANFYHFWRPKFNFQPSPSLLRPLAKNLQKQKSFLPKFVNNCESQRFFGCCWGSAEILWVKISS